MKQASRGEDENMSHYETNPLNYLRTFFAWRRFEQDKGWPFGQFNADNDYDIEGNWNDYPDPEKTKLTRPTYNGFQGKCKRDKDDNVYYLQYCSDDPVQGSKCTPDDYLAIDGSDNVGNILHMRLYSMVIACTKSEIDNGFCENVPENGQRMNPCYTGQVLVEVSNNGDKFSGDGLYYSHTSLEAKSNFMDYEVAPTYATYTYISKKKTVGVTKVDDITAVGGYRNQLTTGIFDEESINFDESAVEEFYKVLQMDKSVCNRPVYAEEAVRDKEVGWYELPFLSYVQLSFDFRNLPADMVYDEHFKVAIYATPSRCYSENCNSNRIRQAPKETLPCNLPMDLPIWFTDPSVNKNQVMNLTMLALDDSLVKVEIHIVHGSYMASSNFLLESTSIQITYPGRAFVTAGQEKVSERSERALLNTSILAMNQHPRNGYRHDGYIHN